MAISGTRTTGDGVSYKDCYVEVDLLGDGNWAAIDSWATDVNVSGEGVPTTSRRPFAGAPETFVGNKEPVTIDVTILFTQGSADPYRQIRARFEAADGPDMEVRWVPAGSGSGNVRFTSSGGKLIAAPAPSGSSEDNNGAVATFQIFASSVSMDTM